MRGSTVCPSSRFIKSYGSIRHILAFGMGGREGGDLKKKVL